MYISTDEFVSLLTTKTTAQLTDDEQGIYINLTLLTTIINNSTELINNYLRGRYTLPLINTHFLLKQICYEITKYELYKRRNVIPDVVKETYIEAIDYLKKLQNGELLLDETNVEQSFVYNTLNSLYTNEL